MSKAIVPNLTERVKMKLRHFLGCLLLILTTACVPASKLSGPNHPPPSIHATNPPATAAGPTAAMPTATPPPTLQPTSTPLLFPTPAASPTALPVTRQTPLTLMLHRSHAKFDAVAFLRDFIALAQQSDLRVVTYRQIAEEPAITATEQGRLLIFTIDDIYLRYPMDPSVREMIALLKEAGYPGVLGIITEGDYAYPETVATLEELTALGWEVASHSDTHRNLRDIQKIAPKGIYPEIKASLDKLEKALGLRPITLILPEGQMTQGDQQLKRADLLWIVGINGGVTYETTATYYYVGREGPAGDAATTFAVMQKRFTP